MTFETLQKEMIQAMKSGDFLRKLTISNLIAQIKTAAIDMGKRDNIDEAFVDSQILKAKKQMQESIDGAKAANRPELLANYEERFKIIDEFAPQIVSDENELREILGFYEGDKTKPAIMKWLKSFPKRIDMKIAAKLVGEFI